MSKTCRKILSVTVLLAMVLTSMSSIGWADELQSETVQETQNQELQNEQQEETAEPAAEPEIIEETQPTVEQEAIAETAEETPPAAVEEEEPAVEPEAAAKVQPSAKRGTALKPVKATEGTAEQFRVTFKSDPPAGYTTETGSMNDFVTEGGYVTLPKNEFSYYIYNGTTGETRYAVFSGWATTKGGNPEYSDQAQIKVDESITLYAIWDRPDSIIIESVPKPKSNVTYNGEAQDVITGGSLKGAPMVYQPFGTVESVPKKYTDAGKYTYKYGYLKDDNFVELGQVTGQIEKASMSAVLADLFPQDGTISRQVAYDGNTHDITPEQSKKYTGLVWSKEWRLSKDETVSDTPVNAGNYNLWVVADESSTNFLAEAIQVDYIKILKKKINISLETDDDICKTYGDPDPVIEATISSGLLDGEVPKAEDVDKLVTRESGEAIGRYAFEINEKALTPNGSFNPDNYTCAWEETPYGKFCIEKRSIKDSEVNIIADDTAEFEGGEQWSVKPKVKVVFKNKELEQGSRGDYIVNAKTAVCNPGQTGSYAIDGINNFKDSSEQKFTVVAKNISSDVKMAKIPDQTYNGKFIVPEMTVTYTNSYDAEITLKEHTDYELVMDDDNKFAGTVRFHLTGTGYYTGRLDGSFEIVKKTPALEDFTVTAPENATYDGEEHKATVTLNSQYSGCDYVVKYRNSKGELLKNAVDADTYKVVIEVSANGDNFESGTLETDKSFTISKKPVTITPKAVSKVYGERDPELNSYDADGVVSGDDFTVTMTRDAGEDVGQYKADSYVVSGEDKDNYTVTFENGTVLNIVPKDISKDVEIMEIPNQTYNGSDITPDMDVTYVKGDSIKTLQKGTDYELKWDGDHKNAGTAKFHLEGKGNYSGKLDGSFKIDKKTPAATDFTVTVTESVTYDGKDHGAAVSLNSPYEGCIFSAVYVNEKGETCDEAVDAGKYAVSISVKAESENFTGKVLETDKIITISKKSVIIKPKEISKAYGQEDPNLNVYNAEGIIPGDDFAISIAREAGEGPGQYKILSYTTSGKDENNYDTHFKGRVVLIITNPEFTEGRNGKHEVAGEKPLRFRSTGFAEKLDRVEVDGQTVSPENYMVEKGSTIITLSAAYLDNLSAGKHVLSAVYKDDCPVDGQLVAREFQDDTDFFIEEKEDSGKDDPSKDDPGKDDPGSNDNGNTGNNNNSGNYSGASTGDTSNPVLPLTIAIASLVIGGLMIVRRRKQ